MKLRSLLPAALVAGSIVVFSACEDENEIAGPLSEFNDFNILVEVTEIGVGTDPNGYVVTISPGDVTERVDDGELLTVRVPKQDAAYSVTISEVAGNCAATDGMSREIRVRVRNQSTLARRADFGIDCG